jgi:orotate phosphoribosyltransferase
MIATGRTPELGRMRDHIEHHGIYRCKPGATIPAKQSGMIYTWQYYLRRCMFDAQFASDMATVFWDVIAPNDFVLGPCEAAGVPLACAIQAKARTLGFDVPILSFKQEPKKYGLMSRTEGPLYKDRPVLLIDDIAGSQATLLRAEAVIMGRGLKLCDIHFCLVNKAGKTVEPHPVYLTKSRLVTLFTSDDFNLTWAKYVETYGREPDFGEYL